MTQTKFDDEVDVLIIGAGSGGFTAALAAHARGLRTLIVEKAPWYGGSTSLSGGGIWVPGAPAQTRMGHNPDPDGTFRYLKEITEGLVSDERLQAYVDEAPRMLEFLENLDPDLQFVWKPGYPDYYPNLPDGSELGSTINVPPVDLRSLGDDVDQLHPPLAVTPRGMWIGPTELPDFYRLRQTWAGKRLFVKLIWRMVRARLTGERVTTIGQALMARLMLALRKRDIQLWLESPMTSLITEDGQVIGALVERGGRAVRVRARGGVVIAAGGFDHNAVMRKIWQPTARADLSLGTKTNTGDGITAAVEAGAALDLMDSAWWFPAVEWGPGKIQFSLNERMLPSQLIVNGVGERWINEAAPYEDFGFEMIAKHEAGVPHIPSWYITDDWSWRRYVIFGHLPILRIPFAPAPTGRRLPKAWRQSDAMHSAQSLPELAAKIGVPQDNLEQTVERYNRDAATGVDTQFHRGESSYDHYYGDITLSNPSLAPLHGGPYYAFRISLSDLGTNGGVVTDEFGRALGEDRKPIDGLYATGNAAASVMGRSYAGAGSTIGPSMTFGYIAAQHIADRTSGRATTEAPAVRSGRDD
ncbi:FAD-binding protein [Rhodococcus sp. NPDC127530]|uniref:FAD-binding protein n=1 Tax=unclassified Rhodococcus (in: high G+C Gram-positive bacteria) TaxID=192944 RepID=UPI0036312663